MRINGDVTAPAGAWYAGASGVIPANFYFRLSSAAMSAVAATRNLQQYGEFVSTKLRMLPGATSIESSFSLKTVKVGGKLPVE